MAPPTAYTESSFRSYLFARLPAALATSIGWESGGDPSFQSILDDAMIVLGSASIATITASSELAQLRAVGRVFLWRTCLEQLIAQYDVTVDGSSFKRSQQIENIKTLLSMASDEAIAAGVDPEALPAIGGRPHMPAATVTSVGYNDPYSSGSSVYGIKRKP
jgi:hypothetical protein